MVSSTLELARENHVHRLRATLEALQKEFNPAGYVLVSACYRVLAACALLLETDTNAYFSHLENAANARLDFLHHVNSGATVEPRYLALSKDLGFTCALASDDWATAEEISRLSHKKHTASVEYEDDFLFSYFMHTLLLETDNTGKFEVMLARWEEVLEGADSGFFDVCQSLCERNADNYEVAFESLLASRTAQLDTYAAQVSADQELLAVERGLFIDAIAVAKLAEKIGLQTNGTYLLMPKLALSERPSAQVARTSWSTIP